VNDTSECEDCIREQLAFLAAFDAAEFDSEDEDLSTVAALTPVVGDAR
jgi:hypothetical protein